MRVITLILTLFLSLSVSAEPLLIAASAGYKKPLMEIYDAFGQSYGTKVEAIFGNLQQVLAQTRDSGRVDLVVGEQAFLARTGLFGRDIALGTGRLVLAYGARRLSGYQALTDTKVERIALPDPKKAIYGQAATQFLERSGLMPAIKGKLMTLATVPQVSAYLAAGTVDAGFINITDALGLKDKLAGYDEIPVDLYDPPVIVLAFPKDRPESEAAKAFAAFLGTAESRAILTRYGL
ncbi:molybdate ABC transporter substrate-binding protein [Thiocystis violascens]|uniref:Molybdenum ABC transporter, periplasmic molybdate-binding protein n=1 Tax=Thiocystis violascens (strain ATCC 17096 / DSM 198 / 6111) TaxID=765911 RepID=I3YEA1_THIV6|nr:molybdate ABC transporter substrate-binding protein [Thiocystis violascens]AFL75319.1 molybdenum ABC transporter, periplasmic molybdate-binding protein [Thiocystis violascens DSM 198]